MGYFKTLWLANDKWGLKCILHNECGYFKESGTSMLTPPD